MKKTSSAKPMASPIDMPDRKPENDEESRLAKFTLLLGGDILGTISAPVVALSWIGRKLDIRLGTRPYILVAGILISFLVSSVAVCHKAIKYRVKYEELTDKPALEKAGQARPPPENNAEG